MIQTHSHEFVRRLIQEKKVLLCVGCGGVGKTTTSASLALAAACMGKRVLCLTIDPAKRLANSLGFKQMDHEAQQVSPEVFEQAKLHVQGSFTIMMLDTKKTFDDLVIKHASSSEVRDAILKNRVYHYVSTALAGTQEYMAMEKLQTLRTQQEYDLIVVDTPPTTNALDFLEAPERMIEAIDSPATRWLIQAVLRKPNQDHRMRINLLNKGSQLMLKAIGTMIGTDFLAQLAGFTAAMNDLFGGFSERAHKVAATLRSQEVAFVLITSPDPMAISEINFLADRLQTLGMSRDLWVVNRMHRMLIELPTLEQIQFELTQEQIPTNTNFAQRIIQAHQEALLLAQRDESIVSSQLRYPSNSTAFIPAFASDVHDVRTLAYVAKELVGISMYDT